MSINKSLGDFETLAGDTVRTKEQSFADGVQLGEYRIICLLGRGGMGEVYLVDNIHTHKRYALKVLPPEVSRDKGFIDRFRVEARVMSDLIHPNIVSVHHMGEDKGNYYLVMDFIGDENGDVLTLEDLLSEKGRLEEEQARRMILEICTALEYSHGFRKGAVIHRDLKPANILLEKLQSNTGAKAQSNSSTPDSTTSDPTSPSGLRGAGRRLPTSSDYTVKVADFGLAKIVGGDYLKSVIEQSIRMTLAGQIQKPPDVSIGNIDRTEAGDRKSSGSRKRSTGAAALIGTYEYMAPEQQEGEDATIQSDIYALGIIIYRMVTGEKPKGRWKLPSKLGCATYWDKIVEKCLEPKPEDRYSSVKEIREEVEKALLGNESESRRIPLRQGYGGQVGESESGRKTDDRRQKTDDGKASNQRSVVSKQTTEGRLTTSDRRPTTFLLRSPTSA